jgi:hypothetical protein
LAGVRPTRSRATMSSSRWPAGTQLRLPRRAAETVMNARVPARFGDTMKSTDGGGVYDPTAQSRLDRKTTARSGTKAVVMVLTAPS